MAPELPALPMLGFPRQDFPLKWCLRQNGPLTPAIAVLRICTRLSAPFTRLAERSKILRPDICGVGRLVFRLAPPESQVHKEVPNTDQNDGNEIRQIHVYAQPKRLDI